VCSSLAPDGVFIASTPNTLIYSQGVSTTNPHHICELAPEEFKDLLSRYFKTVIIYGQRKFAGSTAKGVSIVIGNIIRAFFRGNWRSVRFNGDISQQVSDFEFTNLYSDRCPYIIAVCKHPVK
jgi:hypothetical protein